MKINYKYIDNMRRLENFYGSLKSKWLRNYFLAENSMLLSLDSLTDDAVAGFYNNGRFEVEEDTTVSIQENVIKSCISTLVSKIASQKVRPFFNTVNGSFRDMQVVKQAQQFFDALYDNLNVNKVVSDAFKDSCIFGRGIIYLDREDKSIKRILPWQVFIDPREYSYGHLTKVAWKRTQYPVSLLPFEPDRELDFVTLWKYWDLNKRKLVTYIPEIEYYKEEAWDANVIPFFIMNYESPIKGTNCQSICDVLMGIQLEIDALLVKIKDSSQLTPANTLFVPENSNIDVNKLSNRVGEIVTYYSPQQTGEPIHVATPAFIDPQYLQLLDKFKQDAYELVGISQLSATSRKPQGLNSGVALSTVEDIESDRFETQLNQVVRAYVDIAKLCISVFPPDEDILPPNRLRQSIKWADIVQSAEMMDIQFSAADALSKDPSTKLQQLQALYQAGIISQSRIAQLMEIPDINSGYSLSNNALNAVLQVIDDCLVRNIFEVPDYVPSQMLQEEIINTMLSLKASNNSSNAADIQKLKQLYAMSDKKNVDAMTSAEMAAVSSLQQEMAQSMQNGDFDKAIQDGISQAEIDTNRQDALAQSQADPASNNNME